MDRRWARIGLAAAALVVATATIASAQRASPVPEGPEPASPRAAKTLVIGRRQMVVTANPDATAAALGILRAGGSAVDAAIAAQLVLGLVEPQSSGLGGGAFMVHWDQRRRRVTTFDGREVAPAAADPNQFLSPDGAPIAFGAAVRGGTSVGVPGVPALLAAAHAAHGRLAWARLFEPAIELAERGYRVPARLGAALADPRFGGANQFDDAARAAFFDADGHPLAAGQTVTNVAYAAALREIASRGAAAFYAGRIAEAVVAAAAAAPAPSTMTKADLDAYRVKRRPPLCTAYRGHRLCGMGPPSSGMTTVAETLALVEPFDLGRTAMAPRALHLIAEAERLAFADRDRYVADPDVVANAAAAPAALLDRVYLARRRRLIDADKASATPVDAGVPRALAGRRAGIDSTTEAAGTSDIAIVAASGDAVAMTTTVESAFGSHRMAAGFLLNNELTDFSFRPVDAAGRAIANAVAGSKRPRSSMAPTLMFAPDGRLEAVLGSAGGPEIILHVVKTIVAIVDWHLDPQAAIDLPNFGSRNGPFELEIEGAGAAIAPAMAHYGETVRPIATPSGLAAIVRQAGRGSAARLEGAADSRRDGAALAD